MRKFIFVSILTLIGCFCSAAELVLSGVYQGSNLYIMNPFAPVGEGFCVTEVIVNGTPINNGINSSAFEIDLVSLGLAKGDAVNVVIKHQSGCEPKVINPEVLNAQSTFTVTTIKIDNSGKLKFTTTGESGSLPFIVEQFRWNKWIKVATIDGIGTPGTNNYTADVNLHAGYNRFRVKQIDYTRRPRYGKELKHRATMAEITYSYTKPYTEIKFSAETMYEIYNNKGAIMGRGTATSVNVSALPMGDYYLNYDTKTETFKKR